MALVSSVEAPPGISNAIKRASEATGTDFKYLLATAARESNFKPHARARTSSAAGLFQFIENTWLKTIKEEGAEYGLEKYQPYIRRGDNGRYYVPDRRMRAEILKLRHDADISAMMAGAFTRQNAEIVGSKLGRNPSQGELYIAHFLGPGGAARLIETAEASPNARADRLFPQAAKANRSIFYARGKPRSAKQVYDLLVRDHARLEQVAGLTAENTQRVARAGKGDPLLPIQQAEATKSAPAQTANIVPGGAGQGSEAQKPAAPAAPRAAALWERKLAPDPAAATDTGQGTQTLASLERQHVSHGAAKADRLVPAPQRQSLVALEPELPKPAMSAQPVRVAALDPGSLPLVAPTATDAGMGSIGPWQTIIRHAETAPLRPKPMLMAPPAAPVQPARRVVPDAAARPAAHSVSLPPARKQPAPAAPPVANPSDWPARVRVDLTPAPERSAPAGQGNRIAAAVRTASQSFDLLQSDDWARMSYGGS